MKPPPLSSLVAYINQLDRLQLAQIDSSLRADLAAAAHVICNDPGVGFTKINATVEHAVQQVYQSVSLLRDTVTALRQHAQTTIDAHHAQYLVNSRQLFENEMSRETPDYVLSRRLNCYETDQDLIRGKLLRYADWRVPGMILRPAHESWIDHMVALDPLYLVDTDLALLQPAVQRFAPEYQRRLRPYVVQEQIGRSVLDQLPNDQYGYVFVYNFFNYKPWEMLQQYLTELWQKLRSGGVCLFTFNDCDYAHGVALTERNFMCYTPGSMIQTHLDSLGFETVDRYIGQADVAWFEIRKPGKMRSLKGAQTLATIKLRSK